MKTMKIIIIAALLVVSGTTILMAYFGPPTEEGAKWRAEQAQIEEGQRKTDKWREDQKRQEDIAKWQRSKMLRQQKDILHEIMISGLINEPTVSSFELEKVANYLLSIIQENGKQLNTLQKRIEKLEKQIKQNRNIEKIHWTKVIDLEKKINQLNKLQMRQSN